MSAEATADLVVASRSGDRAAFGVLYQRFGRMVHGVLLARVPAGEARDLTQEVFLVALERLGSLREPAAFPGWLAIIARNRAADWRRARRDTVELDEGLEGASGVDSGTLDVMALLRALPEAYRETLVLRLVEGLTGPEIAVLTGLTEGSVRVNLHRGMKLLRERMGAIERE